MCDARTLNPHSRSVAAATVLTALYPSNAPAIAHCSASRRDVGQEAVGQMTPLAAGSAAPDPVAKCCALVLTATNASGSVVGGRKEERAGGEDIGWEWGAAPGGRGGVRRWKVAGGNGAVGDGR